MNQRRQPPHFSRTIAMRNCDACPRPAAWSSTRYAERTEYLCNLCHAGLYPEDQ